MLTLLLVLFCASMIDNISPLRHTRCGSLTTFKHTQWPPWEMDCTEEERWCKQRDIKVLMHEIVMKSDDRGLEWSRGLLKPTLEELENWLCRKKCQDQHQTHRNKLQIHQCSLLPPRQRLNFQKDVLCPLLPPLSQPGKGEVTCMGGQPPDFCICAQ